MTELHIKGEMARALANTESLIYVASQIFGKKRGNAAPTKKIDNIADAMAFARMVNG